MQELMCHASLSPLSIVGRRRALQPTFQTTTLRLGCSTVAWYTSSRPEQGVHGLRVRLYLISMETIYIIVKDALME